MFLRHFLRAALVTAFTAAAGAQTTPIYNIMYGLPHSAYLGQTVTVQGVVLGVLNSGAFYIHMADTSPGHANQFGARGIEIYSASPGIVAPACQVVGALVTVTGVVQNGTASNGQANTPGTGIQPTSCSASGTFALSEVIDLISATSYSQNLGYSGMVANNTTFNAISPTGGTTDPTTGLVISNGQFWVDIATPKNGHLFKSTGLAADNFCPQNPPAPSCSGIPAWDGNPARLFVDTTTLGGAPVDIGAGQTLTCKQATSLTVGATIGIGLIDYSLGYNRLLIFPTTTCTVSGSIAPSITAPADSTHFHVGTINLANFHSAANDPTRYPTRLKKAALALVNVFGKPDIISVQEVEDLDTLQAIGAQADLDDGNTTTYKAYFSVPNDPNNLGLGFLVNTQNVAVNNTYIIDTAMDGFRQYDGTIVKLWERPPFVLEAGLLRNGQNYQVEIVDIELTTRVGIDNPTNGINLWQRRGAQASVLSTFANKEQTRGQNLLIAGEYNAYSFSDGFVDPVDIIANTGAPTAPNVADPVTSDSGETPMYNFVKSITVSNSTYNVIENGNARSIEHILCSQTQNTSASGSIFSYISTVTQPHWTTDYPAIDANDATIAAGLTDRDGFVGAFLIPPVPTTASLTPATADFGSVYRGNSSTQTFTFTNTSTFPSTVTVKQIGITVSGGIDFTQTSNCTSLNQNASCTITVTFSPTASGARSATMTVTSDSDAEPDLTATLTGTGLDTTATLSPLTAAYPSTVVGTTSAPLSFTWTNTSTVPLTISSVSTVGNFAVASTTCTGSIAAGATCTVAVTFTPSASGARTGSVTVSSSSTLNPTLTATLTGTGTSNLEISATQINFGNVDLGFPSLARTLSLTNHSPTVIALSSFAATSEYAFTTTCGATLSSQQSCSVTLIFTPTALSQQTGTFSFATDDPSATHVAVSLTGNGVDFTFVLSPTSESLIAGLTARSTATLTSLGGFNSNVTVSCDLPQVSGSQCYPSGPTGLSTVLLVQVGITTTSPYTIIAYNPAGVARNLWMALFALLSLAGLCFSRKRRSFRLGALAAFFLITCSLANLGCSGKYPDRNANPTAPGTYIYNLTATDGQLVHKATFTLTTKDY